MAIGMGTGFPPASQLAIVAIYTESRARAEPVPGSTPPHPLWAQGAESAMPGFGGQGRYSRFGPGGGWVESPGALDFGL